MTKKLYVGNLNEDTTEAELEALFSAYGTVSSVMIKKDSVTGEPWGYGFVVMESPESAQIALEEANGQELRKHKIRVNEMRSL